jgi:hypothetical protein
MQPRFEGSLMTSLAELRAIEEERIAAERAAITAEVEGRKRALIEAEQRAKDAAEAKLAAERAEEIRIAREREHAERQARMHVEAVEAAERARLAAALEQERTAQELDLRRQEVAKKRPTWMVAVTIGAVLAAGALTWFGLGRLQQAEAANEQERIALQQADAARRERDEAVAKMNEMDGELALLSQRVDKAMDQVLAAGTAAARLAAKNEVDRIRRQEAELQARRAAAKKALEDRIRKGGHHTSKACLDNPLAPECM